MDLKDNMRLCLWNAQSIKGKDTLLHDYMLSAQLDTCILMETWLKDKDDIWLQTSDLQTDGYKCCLHNRERPSGGLALIHKDLYKVMRIDEGYMPTSFEKCPWKMEKGNKMITLEVIYHPPGRPGQSILHFTEELTEYVEKYVITRHNPILLGDFNVHVNDLDDAEAMDFLTTMEVMGFVQHVDFSTQKKGNTLDLIFTHNMMQISVLRTLQGPFLSDHCVIIATIGMLCGKWEHRLMTHRKLKYIDMDQLGTLIQGILSAVDTTTRTAEQLASDFHNIAGLALDVFALQRTTLQTI